MHERSRVAKRMNQPSTLSLWVCVTVVSEAPLQLLHHSMTHDSSWSLRCTGACRWLTQANNPHLFCFFCCFYNPYHLFFLLHFIKDSVCLQVPNSSPIFSRSVTWLLHAGTLVHPLSKHGPSLIPCNRC